MPDTPLSDSSDSVTRLLPALRGQRGEPGFISVENLAYEVRQRLGRPISTSYIQQLEWGKRPPSREVLEAIAAHFDLPPQRFLEYRLARARRLLDEREVGLDAAAENYMLIEDVFAGVLTVNDRLAESDTELAARVTAWLEDRRRQLAEGQESTAAEDPPLPAAKSERAAPRRAARPR